MDFYASWSPVSSVTPGASPVDHGTMCAYDVMLAAPHALFLDYALLQSTRGGNSQMDGILSDAVQGFSRLLQLMLLPDDERQFRSMVVSNSWAMFNPSWDFPPGNPGRYADNRDHPFNVIVQSLSQAGADIVFAAGNCGLACPNDRCYPLVPLTYQPLPAQIRTPTLLASLASTRTESGWVILVWDLVRSHYRAAGLTKNPILQRIRISWGQKLLGTGNRTAEPPLRAQSWLG